MVQKPIITAPKLNSTGVIMTWTNNSLWAQVSEIDQTTVTGKIENMKQFKIILV